MGRSYNRNLHEGEFVSIPSKYPLPINCLDKSATPSVGPSRISSPAELSSIPDSPNLLHQWSQKNSVLCLIPAPTKRLIFCGTQDSKILVYDLIDYSLKLVLNNDLHSKSSILSLEITEDERYLFSAGSDSLVKVWNLQDLDNISCCLVIYSLVDIGDIFSLTWCNCLNTIFIGAQNASLLWCQLYLDNLTNDAQNTFENLPHIRYDKFFDSKGPGGSINLLQSKHQQYYKQKLSNSSTTKILEIGLENYIRFAHNGYVYCLDNLNCGNKAYIPFNFNESYQVFLISGGGDGIINIWGITSDIKIVKLKSLENDEPILSMSIQNSYIYVGLSNSTINVWDLSTFQLIRSFNFINEKNVEAISSSYNEVLSLAIYNDCIFKASNIGGLIKFKLNNYLSTDNSNQSMSNDTNSIIISDDYNGFLNSKINDAVLTVKIFNHGSSTYLVSGGNKALCLWDITNVGIKRNLSIVENSMKSLDFDIYSNEQMLKSLQKFISFKTISKYPTLYLEESRHCAQYLSKILINLNAYQTKLLPVENGNPIVYASFKANKRGIDSKPKRLLWYAHYDVVDATLEVDDWKTNPFVMTARDGNLYARGISDNKGPSLAAIYAVAELYEKELLSCDVVFLIEGEEESGSIGFQEVINENKEFIGDIDWIMLSNSYWLDDETPCLNYGLRGVITGSISVKSDRPDRHSGVDGGVSREPTMDLVQILSQLVDPSSNKIQLPGFYDGVLPLTEKEIQLYQNIENRNILDQDLKSLMAKWRNPSLTVHKIQVSGPHNNTVIPQNAKATISIRIVPYQDITEIKLSLRTFIEESFKKLGSENHLVTDIFYEAEPWLGDPFNLVYNILAEKIEKNWGIKPLFIREGGSIPSIRFLEKCFNAPAAQIPCGQASDNAHLKDEKLRIINLYKLRSILRDTFMELGTKEVQ